MAEKERCETCRFWDAKRISYIPWNATDEPGEKDYSPGRFQRLASCLRGPPTVGKYMGEFPTMEPHRWCGEYQPREET